MSDISDSRAPGSTALMLYDGFCGFCNWSVRWVIKRDRHDRFRFAPQQSGLAEAVLARHGVDPQAMLAANSVYLVLGYDLAGRTAALPLGCYGAGAAAAGRWMGACWTAVGSSAKIPARLGVYACGSDTLPYCRAV